MSRRAMDYIHGAREAMSLLCVKEIESGFRLLADALRDDRAVYICGNGGSSSTASHMASDLGKNIRSRSGRHMRVTSLTDNASWLTAIANDGCYEDSFAEQLRGRLKHRDVVIGISASGNSDNVVRAFELAHRSGVDRLALVGFDGGRLARLATHCIRVDSSEYGVVESVHLLVAHLLVRMLASEMLPAGDGDQDWIQRDAVRELLERHDRRSQVETPLTAWAAATIGCGDRGPR